MYDALVRRFALFSGPNSGFERWLNGDTDGRILSRISTIDRDPLSRAQLNQLLLLAHEAGMSAGFYKYYWLHAPAPHRHPYRVEAIEGYSIDYSGRASISSIEHLRWGLYRLYVDALLFFGNVRTAYRVLRSMTFDELTDYYNKKCIDFDSPSGMVLRGPPLPLDQIPRDDRYLISEMACKSFDPLSAGDVDMLNSLEATFKKVMSARTSRTKSVSIKDLISGGVDKERQMEFEFSAAEFIDETVDSIASLRKKYATHKTRFDQARESALRNTEIYLSLVNDLDVYVATSMRSRDDFRNMASNCDTIFRSDLLREMNIRYFDPTLSAAPGHEDKGLIECLMVKCAKVLIYIRGEKESYGKDAEAAMALSLGKPVVFYCADETHARFYKEVHPLSRLIEFQTGVAVGACVTHRIDQIPILLHRILTNGMEYELKKPKENYLQLCEKLTSSVVRIQTNNIMLRETFWNHYHNPV